MMSVMYAALVDDIISQNSAADKIMEDVQEKVMAAREKFQRVREMDFPALADLQNLIEESREIVHLTNFAIEAIRESLGSVTRAGKLRVAAKQLAQPLSESLSSALEVRKSATDLLRSVSVYAGHFD